jgi:hypothetical protein
MAFYSVIRKNEIVICRNCLELELRVLRKPSSKSTTSHVLAYLWNLDPVSGSEAPAAGQDFICGDVK